MKKYQKFREDYFLVDNEYLKVIVHPMYKDDIDFVERPELQKIMGEVLEKRIPVPHKGKSDTHYPSWEKVYGKPNSWRQPKLTPSKVQQKKFLDSLKNPTYRWSDNKARLCIRCKDCNKPRLVYSNNALSKYTPDERRVLQTTLDECDFICGDSLLDVSRADHKTFIENEIQVQRQLSCNEPVELRYYNLLANQKKTFLDEERKTHPPCAFCGEPLSYDLVGKFNDFRVKKNKVWPCCGGGKVHAFDCVQ